MYVSTFAELVIKLVRGYRDVAEHDGLDFAFN